MKYFFVEGRVGWFVVHTTSKRRAVSIGVLEFGRGNVTLVREATPEEISDYTAVKSKQAMRE